MFKRAVRLGLVGSNPVKVIPKVKEAGGRVVYLPPTTKERSAHEDSALTKALPAELRPLFLVSVHTGLRWSEQSALRWQDVDVLRGTLTVSLSKNGYQRTVPMNATVRSVFLDASLARKRTDQPNDRVFPMPYRTTARTFDRSVKAAQATLRGGREGRRLAGGLHLALQPPHVRLTAGHGRRGPTQGATARGLANGRDGHPVRAPRAGSPTGSRRTPVRRRTWSQLGLAGLSGYHPRLVSVRSSRHGGLASTGKAVDLKSTGPRGPWGFESLALRQLRRHTPGLSRALSHIAVHRRRGGEMLLGLSRLASSRACP
jgi:integrase